MTMHMGIRIKASEDFNDILALNIVGGHIVDGKYPKFRFSSDIQRNRYNAIRKELKGGEGIRLKDLERHVSRALNRLHKLQADIDKTSPGAVMEEIGFFLSSGSLQSVIENLETAKVIIENEKVTPVAPEIT